MYKHTAIEAGASAGSTAAQLTTGHDRLRVLTAPPINRGSMAPVRWPHRAATAVSPDPHGHWQRAGTVRRTGLAVVVAAQTYFATQAMTMVLPYHGTQPLEMLVLALFAVLSCWVSAGFCMAVMGFFTLATGRDRYAISARAAGMHRTMDARSVSA